jgi:CBS domain-containing protein
VRVRDVMPGPVVCVPPDMRLKKVADLLVTRAISAVPVVEDGELVGIVSEADLVPLELAPDPRAHLIPLADAPGHLPTLAAEAMTREVVALPEDADLAEAGRLLLERRVKSIPIVRGRQVVGIVARRDLLAVLARRDEDIAWDLEALLATELGAPSPYRLTVQDGIVRLTAPADPTTRRLAPPAGPRGAGVVEVRFVQR